MCVTCVLQAQRRRAVLEQRHRGGLGQRDGRHAHNYRKVRQLDRQQRSRLAVALFEGGRQQPVHHDGGTGFPVRFVNHRATVQPATLAVHHVLPHAPQVRPVTIFTHNRIPRQRQLLPTRDILICILALYQI